MNYNLRNLAKKSRYEKIIRVVTQSVHSSIELSEVFENAVEVMNKHIETAENVSIYMVESKTAVLKAYRGYPEDIMRTLTKIPYPKGFTWRTITEGEPMYCPDVDKDPYIGPKGKQLGTKSYVSMPILCSGNAIGCINVNSNKKYSFDKEELSLLETVAKQIETAINNAKQAEALRKSEKALKEYIAKLTRKNRYERVISAVTKSIHRSLELDQVFENAARAINKEIQEAEQVVVYMVEEKKEAGETTPVAVIKASSGYEKWHIDHIRRIPYPKGTTWNTIIEGKSRYVPDIDKDDIIGEAGKGSGIKSYISVPLSIEGNTVGCVHICSSKKRAFRKYDILLVENVSKQLETAINNAKQAEALRKSEEALRKSRDDLEERVDERTFELQKANTLLIKEILERRCVESELKQSLAEKDVLFKEIHHRVKNNLQIISSLLNLESRQIKDQKALASFNESKNRIRSIATLHEQLYRSKDVSRIDFTAYMRNMTNYLLRTYGVGNDFIRVNMNTERIYLDLNTAIPCGLIVNELVSNAIKHGFPDGGQGEIKIDFKKKDDKYFLSVSNNGVRFPKGLDINNCTTLGLELISSLSKQLKGKLSLTREGVTEFKLEFAA